MIQALVAGVVAAAAMLAAAVVGFFFLLLALNGFSERQAEPMLAAYIALAVLCVIGAAAVGGLGARALTRSGRLSAWASALLALLGSCLAGLGVFVTGSFVILLVGSSLVR